MAGRQFRTLSPASKSFKEEIYGDWVVYNPNRHLGEVYVNGKSLRPAEASGRSEKSRSVTEEVTELRRGNHHSRLTTLKAST
ncbi:MAG: hypothetical protein U5K84_05305 [Alkalibacterium sp.]|nr:hypothetical protein [Alkalibacterium sp.]